ncbi:branched-chain amino acid transport system ATP-binding protein [Thermomonospora echinospora]|uniref:Branched-chain amino acid transport system ATP-binding protein n=1 Tax=Thermomonospora echinospora TaxID=1992 RepID=A0A1H6BMQ7_9ACTN|nr:ABC transporter ATP-binding protein [Thermomonospora echinospora]SEG61999.1 branched-chain amino acid transport system ATP-binding protein [Thermomonospora echinospora]
MTPVVPPVVEVGDLVVRYGTATALDRVSLTVGAGELVALVGPNGAGKSSLVNAIMGIVRPASGRVRVSGRVALVPEGRQMFGDLSVDDNLRLGAWRRRGRPGARDTSRVYEVLPELTRVRHQRAGTLSGGQQQMVAFGRALMAEPDVVVVDELSLGLAPMVTAGLAEHLRSLNAGRGLAVLLIEQNARLALDLCGRGYVLEAGRIRAQGSADELARSAEVAAAYLGGPATTAEPGGSGPEGTGPDGTKRGAAKGGGTGPGGAVSGREARP